MRESDEPQEVVRLPQVWMKNTCTLSSIRFPQGLKWQKARRLLLRLDKRGEDKVEGERVREAGERRKEEEKRRNQRKEVEGRRKAFEQGLRKEIRAVDLFQPRITQCQSQYQSKVKNNNLYPMLRFLQLKMDLAINENIVSEQHLCSETVGRLMLVG